VKRRISVDDMTFVVVGTAETIREPIEKAIPRLASTTVTPFDSEP
jgi:hypothetical protein